MRHQVSKAPMTYSFTTTVCELIGESKNELTITNNRPGFIQLLHELTAFSKLDI